MLQGIHRNPDFLRSHWIPEAANGWVKLWRPIRFLREASSFPYSSFRNWWRALPHNKRQHFYQSLRRHKYKILATLLGLTGICSVYYYSHLQTTPITNRRRFIAFTDSQFKKIAATEYEKVSTALAPNLLITDIFFLSVHSCLCRPIYCLQVWLIAILTFGSIRQQ